MPGYKAQPQNWDQKTSLNKSERMLHALLLKITSEPDRIAAVR